MTTNEFLQKYRAVNRYGDNATRPRVKCADGYTVSIQAGRGIYSKPRGDSANYTHVELGFPSTADRELMGFAEDPEHLTDTVYGYVPVTIVDYVLSQHGGIVGADLSNIGGEWND